MDRLRAYTMAAGGTRRRGRLAGVAAAIVVAALANGVAATPATAAGDPGTEDCLLNAETQRLDCYPDFRAAMAAATGGQVTDAPPDAADLDARTISRITAAGKVSTARTASASAAARVVLSIGYDMANYTGSTLSLVSSTDCSGGKTKYYNSWFDHGWNDRISSYRNVSNCASYFYEKTNQTGWYDVGHAQGGRPTLPADRDNEFGSAKLFAGPTGKQVVELCGLSSSTCTFTNAELSEVNDSFHEVSRLDNCSPFASQVAVSWSDTTGGSITLGTTVTTTAEFGVGALSKVSASISTSVGREWNWSNTVTSTTTLNVPAWAWAALDRSPRLQHVKGQVNVTTKSKKWGRKTWSVYEFEGVVEVANHLGHIRTRGDVMTDEHREQVCSVARSQRLPESMVFDNHYDLAS